MQNKKTRIDVSMRVLSIWFVLWL